MWCKRVSLLFWCIKYTCFKYIDPQLYLYESVNWILIGSYEHWWIRLTLNLDNWPSPVINADLTMGAYVQISVNLYKICSNQCYDTIQSDAGHYLSAQVKPKAINHNFPQFLQQCDAMLLEESSDYPGKAIFLIKLWNIVYSAGCPCSIWRIYILQISCSGNIVVHISST